MATVLSSTYQSAGAVKSLGQQIIELGKGLATEKGALATGKAVTNLQEQIDFLIKTLRLAGSSYLTAADVTIPVILKSEFTLAAASTSITSPSAATDGAILFIVIIIDGTAGRQITWASNLKGVTVDDLDNEANKLNFYQFIGRADGNWWCCSMRLGL